MTGSVQKDSVLYGVNSYTRGLLSDDTTYLFTVKTVDSSGAEGNASNTVEITPHGNVAGNALLLDGSSGYVAVRDTTILSSVVSIEAWVRRVAGGSGQPTIVDKNIYKLKFDGTGAQQHVKFIIKVGGVLDSVISNQPLTAGMWYHVAGVYDQANTQMLLYINGVLDNNKTKSGLITAGTDSVFIGKAYIGLGDYFNGQIDEVRLWNVVRSQAQLQSSMSKPLVGNETGLVGYWRMDEQVGTKRYDATVYGNDGKASGNVSPARSNVFPVFPKNVTVANSGFVNTLTWTNGGSTNVKRYRVYKSIGGGSSGIRDSVLSSITTYRDTVLSGNIYDYYVTAVDSLGTESDSSNHASTILSSPPPPTIVVGTGGDKSVTVSWVGTTGYRPWKYRIYWQTVTGSVQKDSVLYGVNSYTRGLLSDDTTYLFTVKTVDSSGAEGNASNTVEITPHGNVAGNALLLDGSSGYVAVRDTTILSSVVSIEAWVRRVAGGSGQPTIVDKNIYKLKFDGTGAQQHVKFIIKVGGVLDSVISNQPLTAGMWYHVAGVYDQANTQMLLYINGVLDNNKTKSGLITAGTDSVFIGKAYIGLGDYFNGQIDEVRLWNVVRSRAQLQSSMSKPLVGNETGLVGYWRMDEQVGTKRYDATVYGNDGKASGNVSPARSNVFPVFPKNVTVANSGFVNTLTWTNGGSTNVKRYRVYKSIGGGSSGIRDSVLSSITTYRDTGTIGEYL